VSFSLTYSHGRTFENAPHEGACPVTEDCPWGPYVHTERTGDAKRDEALAKAALFQAFADHCAAHADGSVLAAVMT
jgi:hypothetical protein